MLRDAPRGLRWAGRQRLHMTSLPTGALANYAAEFWTSARPFIKLPDKPFLKPRFSTRIGSSRGLLEQPAQLRIALPGRRLRPISDPCVLHCFTCSSHLPACAADGSCLSQLG